MIPAFTDTRCCGGESATESAQRRKRTLESCLMRVLVYSSKNQENLKLHCLTSISTYRMQIQVST